MSGIKRYQLRAYVYDGGASLKFRPHGWATAGQIAINAPMSARYILVLGPDHFVHVWDMQEPGYTNMTNAPPPLVDKFEDIDQALMALTLKGKGNG